MQMTSGLWRNPIHFKWRDNQCLKQYAPKQNMCGLYFSLKTPSLLCRWTKADLSHVCSVRQFPKVLFFNHKRVLHSSSHPLFKETTRAYQSIDLKKKSKASYLLPSSLPGSLWLWDASKQQNPQVKNVCLQTTDQHLCHMPDFWRDQVSKVKKMRRVLLLWCVVPAAEEAIWATRSEWRQCVAAAGTCSRNCTPKNRKDASRPRIEHKCLNTMGDSKPQASHDGFLALHKVSYSESSIWWLSW